MTDNSKVLCLHGYNQNTEIFNKTFASFKNRYKNTMDFDIINAPNKITDNTYGWYYYNENDKINVNWADYFNTINDPAKLLGLDASVNLIKEYLKKNPDVEYIIGFSQGSAFLSYLCYQNIIPSDKKLIFISGFWPLTHDTLSKPLEYQTLHIMGEKDEIIPIKENKHLASIFANYKEIIHKGKHTIPLFGISTFYK